MAIPGGGIFTGMATTLRNLFAPKVTLQYPEERPQMPERWRGRLDLIYDPYGEHKCEVCFQCAQVCPVEAIDMSGFDAQGNRIRYGLRNAARWDEVIDTAFVDGVVDGFHARPEALVAIFNAVQARYGYLPERALRRISDRMVIHWAQVFGAAGLGGFRLLPVEGHMLTVCTCAACRFAGGEALLRESERLLGVRAGETTPDGAFSLETSADVAAGAIAPAVRIDTLVYGPLTAEHLGHLIAQRGVEATSDGGNGRRRRPTPARGKA